MVVHYIFSGSSYCKGTRIAFHRSYIGGIDKNEVDSILQALKKHPEIHYSSHFIVTDSLEWESVTSYDSFFRDMKLCSSIERFIQLLEEDHVLTGLDISKFLISQYGVKEHLKLQKLVYLCYADYLCKYGKKLFSDSVMAFKLGPVVQSVYEEFKGSRYIKRTYSSEAVRSKIMQSKDYKQILQSISDTMSSFGSMSSTELVNLTHKEGSPWKNTFSQGSYLQGISDEKIINYHSVEA